MGPMDPWALGDQWAREANGPLGPIGPWRPWAHAAHGHLGPMGLLGLAPWGPLALWTHGPLGPIAHSDLGPWPLGPSGDGLLLFDPPVYDFQSFFERNARAAAPCRCTFPYTNSSFALIKIIETLTH